VTAPFHAGKILHPKVVRNIQEDAGMTPDEFAQLLKDI
jgi:predicted RNA binding protein YcfA (HicA-like mRNA interferase family)